MQKALLNIIFLILVFVFNLIPQKSNCDEKILEGFSSMKICTGGKSIDEFLSEFELSKVNKIIIKQVILAGETRKGMKTLATIKNKRKVEWIISAINKVQCYDDYVLGYCSTELWLYENNKLRLKLALNVDEISATAEFYKPEDVPYIDQSLGKATFFIVDKKLCYWLLELKGLKPRKEPAESGMESN